MNEQLSLYPNTPGYKARDTSQQAAEDAQPRAETLRQKVYALLACRALSADDAAEQLGEDKLSIRPRFSELARMGKIFDTGRRTMNRSGKKAIVWSVK